MRANAARGKPQQPGQYLFELCLACAHTCAMQVNIERQRFRDTDCIGDLNRAPAREARFLADELQRRRMPLGAMVLNRTLPPNVRQPAVVKAAAGLRDVAADTAQVRELAAGDIQRLLNTADVLAWIDFLSALAELAAERNYVRPKMRDVPVLEIVEGRLRIEKEGKVKKLVKEVEQVSFSGRRGVMQGQDVTYVTERCVLRLSSQGLVLAEIAPDQDLQELLAQMDFQPLMPEPPRLMDAALFAPEPMGLRERLLKLVQVSSNSRAGFPGTVSQMGGQNKQSLQ